MGILSDYKKNWAKDQLKYSDHPLEFWLQVIDMAVEGRKVLQADQLNPLGIRPDQMYWQDYLAIVMQTGIDLEEKRGMDDAFVMYEICVAELYNHDLPYDRLKKWYEERRWLKDAMRVAGKRLKAMKAVNPDLPDIKFTGFKVDKKA